MILVELGDHGVCLPTEHADPNLALLEVLSDFDIADGHKSVVPFIIFLNDIADFTAEEFVDSIETAGHGMEMLKK
jgi:hypothetical protein